MMSIVKDFMRWIYWHPCRFVMQRLPLQTGYNMADFLAPLFAAVSIKDSRVIREGIEGFYEDKISARKIDTILLKTFKNTIYTAVEVLWYPKLSRDLCKKISTIRGIENLDEGLKQNRGVVLLHGHFGNAHMIMPLIGYRGYKLYQLASRIPPEPIPGFIGGILYLFRKNAFEIKLSYKETLPVNFIYTDRSIREVLRALQRNEVIAIGFDGREGTKPEIFDFLGHKAIFYTGTMKLIMKAKPVVLPTFHLRDGGKHVLVIEKPVDLTDMGDEKASLTMNMRKLIVILESYVHRYPDHYVKVFSLGDRFFVSSSKRMESEVNL